MTHMVGGTQLLELSPAALEGTQEYGSENRAWTETQTLQYGMQVSQPKSEQLLDPTVASENPLFKL